MSQCVRVPEALVSNMPGDLGSVVLTLHAFGVMSKTSSAQYIACPQAA